MGKATAAAAAAADAFARGGDADGSSLLHFFVFGDAAFGGTPVSALLLLTVWLLGFMGWSVVPVLVVILSLYSYRMRIHRRQRNHAVWTIQQCLQEPAVAKRVLGNDLPNWLRFPSVEKCVWLERVLDSLWPHIAKATEVTLMKSLNPTLELFRPKFLTKLMLSAANLGAIPLQITGIQSFRETDEESVIDMHFTWRGNPDIRIVAAVGLLEVEAAVRDFQINGLMRVVLGPHCAAWPCFASASLSFVGKPHVDFALKAMKIPFDAIPGLSAWLDGFLRNTLAWLMVYPKRLVVKILDEKEYGSQESSAEPVGTLHVTVHGCEDLHDKGFFTKLTSFATAEVVSGGETRGLKRSVSLKGKAPKYKANFSFTVYNVPNERLIIRVLDDGHANVVSKAAKTATIGRLNVGFDNLIGKVEVFVASLIDNKHEATVRLVDPKQSTNSVGKVHFSTEFVPFFKIGQETAEVGADGPGVEKGAVVMADKARVAADETSSKQQSQAATNEPTNVSLTRTMQGATTVPDSQDSGDHSGILIITLDRCDSLIKSDLFGQSDPFVVFTIGVNSAKSTVVYKTCNPVFGNQKFELEVSSVGHDILEVDVFDKDILRNQLIGTCSIPVSEVYRSNGKLRDTRRLSPQGTITLDLKLLTSGR